MAYSAWSESSWYVYWIHYREEEKENSVLTVHLRDHKPVSLGYSFIKDFHIQDVADFIKSELKINRIPEFITLEKCFEEFLSEVDCFYETSLETY